MQRRRFLQSAVGVVAGVVATNYGVSNASADSPSDVGLLFRVPSAQLPDSLQETIKRSGEMWESVRDRSTSPVLLVKSQHRGGTVWELSLENGAHHPNWTIKERALTDEEWREIFELDCLGTLHPLISSLSSHYEVAAYVKNGRKPSESGWTVTGRHVNVHVERVE